MERHWRPDDFYRGNSEEAEGKVDNRGIPYGTDGGKRQIIKPKENTYYHFEQGAKKKEFEAKEAPWLQGEWGKTGEQRIQQSAQPDMPDLRGTVIPYGACADSNINPSTWRSAQSTKMGQQREHFEQPQQDDERMENLEGMLDTSLRH